MEVRRAAVFGGGNLYGAYSAGVASVIGKELGVDFFQGGVASSVGTTALPLLLSGQTEILEDIWRNLISGTRLIEITLANLLRRKAIKLEYLTEMALDERTRLDLDKLFSSGKDLTFVLTDLKTGEPYYLKPDRENIFRGITASCSFPVGCQPVKFNGSEYIDGSLSDPAPVERAFKEGYDEVVLVSNYPAGYERKGARKRFLDLTVSALYLLHPEVTKLVRDHDRTRCEKIELHSKDPRVKSIRPSRNLPLASSSAPNHEKLNATVDLGIEDAQNFLRHAKL